MRKKSWPLRRILKANNSQQRPGSYEHSGRELHQAVAKPAWLENRRATFPIRCYRETESAENPLHKRPRSQKRLQNNLRDDGRRFNFYFIRFSDPTIKKKPRAVDGLSNANQGSVFDLLLTAPSSAIATSNALE
jgi:hypothetical protein